MNEKSKKRYDISVIVPNYNSTDKLLSCLESIYNQQTKCKYEVIVVDSSDVDPSAEISKFFSEAQVIHYDKRIYPGTARNFGVKNANSDLLAFTDADCIVENDWIENIYEIQKRESLIIGGSIRNGYKNNLIATAEYFIEFGEFLPTRKFGMSKMLLSCNFSIEKQLYEKIGGFKDLKTGEDVLFFYELKKLHKNLYIDPKIAITHFNRKDLRIYLLKQKEQGIGSYLLRKRANIAGAWLTKNRLFSLFIPGIRLIAIIKKVVHNDYKKICILTITSPIIFIGLIAYTIGFWQAFKME